MVVASLIILGLPVHMLLIDCDPVRDLTVPMHLGLN